MLYNIRKYLHLFCKFLYKKRVHRKAMSVGHGLKINFPTKVTAKTILGNNFNSNGLRILGSGMVTFGDNFHCGFGCVIITENHNHMGNSIPYDSTYIIKDTFIEDNVWFGINVIVLPGVTIGEGAIIQAGSVVVCDIPALAIAGGHPAKVFSWRDKEHYYSLKQQKAFH
ncbi:TPA: acyltransferase [Klebsiella pneumoniae]|nr:acyltransferase [Klebsiella pneumoniae]EIX9320404.1 acyltransferase [Klebsiella pneumoniae]MBD7488719.1 acyltransferase [Klebsiella pneumoniae]MBR8629523.1 acyltransferase [Klebsiella pneumoniae subsp. pneumoniae]MCB3234296.1 acyltransferase [Klebsiella pneumoniae]MCM2142029.1 acyltransferase [Klebsiella pneumoniae]